MVSGLLLPVIVCIWFRCQLLTWSLRHVGRHHFFDQITSIYPLVDYPQSHFFSGSRNSTSKDISRRNIGPKMPSLLHVQRQPAFALGKPSLIGSLIGFSLLLSTCVSFSTDLAHCTIIHSSVMIPGVPASERCCKLKSSSLFFFSFACSGFEHSSAFEFTPKMFFWRWGNFLLPGLDLCALCSTHPREGFHSFLDL